MPELPRRGTERPSLSGLRVLVTGGAGFIGSHLCEAILAEGPSRLTIVDDFSLGKDRNIKEFVREARFELYRKDVASYSSMKEVIGIERPEIVFNLAVIPLPKSLRSPQPSIETNIKITTVLCELLRKKMFGTLVHCSSSEAYGSALYVPMDEKHPERPLTPYAASKIACDHIAMSYRTTFELDVAIARPFNSYGPRQNEWSYAGVVPLTIRRILSGESPVIYGDGNQTRDYTYVDDTVKGILGVYKSRKARGRIINIASGKEIRIGQLIRLIADIMDYRGKIVHKPARPGDVRRHKGDITLARSLLGYSPAVSFREGLRSTVEWYQREFKQTGEGPS
jgi:UDP-glucose 4-epimerase